MRKLLLIGLVLIGSMISSVIPVQANDIRSERVQFSKGEIGATIHSTLSGRETVDYKLRARAGQTMIVGIETDNPGNYFNVLAPDEQNIAFFVGSMSGNRYQGELPVSGDYTIRVYLMRYAARRGETANYTLEIGIAAAGDVPSEADSGRPSTESSTADAIVAGTNFNATGEIPCARHSAQPMSPCRFGVIRRGNGAATLTVFWPDGGARYIYFENGKATSSDATSAVTTTGAVTTERQGDLNKLSIGSEERFEIPDAVIFGG
jgi:hypothetical protein